MKGENKNQQLSYYSNDYHYPFIVYTFNFFSDIHIHIDIFLYMRKSNIFSSPIAKRMDEILTTNDRWTREKHTDLFNISFMRHGAFRKEDPKKQGNL